MYPVLIRVGSFELRTYGVIVGLSFLLGLWLSVREAKRKGLDPALVQDFAFYAFLGGIVGARLYYVVLSQPDYFMRRPWEIFAIWHGGLGILGALAGGFLAAGFGNGLVPCGPIDAEGTADMTMGASTSNAPQPARACERAVTSPPWEHPSCNLDLK